MVCCLPKRSWSSGIEWRDRCVSKKKWFELGSFRAPGTIWKSMLFCIKLQFLEMNEKLWRSKFFILIQNSARNVQKTIEFQIFSNFVVANHFLFEWFCSYGANKWMIRWGTFFIKCESFVCIVQSTQGANQSKNYFFSNGITLKYAKMLWITLNYFGFYIEKQIPTVTDSQ